MNILVFLQLRERGRGGTLSENQRVPGCSCVFLKLNIRISSMINKSFPLPYVSDTFRTLTTSCPQISHFILFMYRTTGRGISKKRIIRREIISKNDNHRKNQELQIFILAYLSFLSFFYPVNPMNLVYFLCLKVFRISSLSV